MTRPVPVQARPASQMSLAARPAPLSNQNQRHDMFVRLPRHNRPIAADRECIVQPRVRTVGSAYRAMEQLRNHAQHRSLPLHELKWEPFERLALTASGISDGAQALRTL